MTLEKQKDRKIKKTKRRYDMKNMKAGVCQGDGTVEVVEVPAPDITDDYECLVRVTACGLCSSTDLKIIGYGSVGEMPIEYP